MIREEIKAVDGKLAKYHVVLDFKFLRKDATANILDSKGDTIPIYGYVDKLEGKIEGLEKINKSTYIKSLHIFGMIDDKLAVEFMISDKLFNKFKDPENDNVIRISNRVLIMDDNLPDAKIYAKYAKAVMNDDLKIIDKSEDPTGIDLSNNNTILSFIMPFRRNLFEDHNSFKINLTITKYNKNIDV